MILDLPRYYADFRRARGGGWEYVVRDRERLGREVAAGWSAGGKRDARCDANRQIARLVERDRAKEPA